MVHAEGAEEKGEPRTMPSILHAASSIRDTETEWSHAEEAEGAEVFSCRSLEFHGPILVVVSGGMAPLPTRHEPTRTTGNGRGM
jgi:hypothetical protein